MTWAVLNLYQGNSFADSLMGSKMKVEDGLDGESGGERYSRDLLQRFRLTDGNSTEKSQYKSPNEETEELELSLGLSLGGRFGTEKSSKRLTRSSSAAGPIPFMWEEKLGSTDRQSASFRSIIRTCSLPTEAEEELRKRKEWQSLRRMEVKRRRCVRQRKGGDKDRGDEITGEATINFVDMPYVFGNGKVPGVGMSLPSVRLQGSAANAGRGLIGAGGVVDLGSKGKEGILGVVGGVGDGSYGLVGYGIVNSLGLVEAQNGSSTGSGNGTDSDRKPTQGSSTSNETKSQASNGLFQERINDDSMILPAAKTPKEGMQVILPRQDASMTKARATGTGMMEGMPSVFTKGDGPNGVRVDGILYKYGKGEEVKIMCVCHGKFLSPAEFVKHAGGGDVSNPRRHIFIDTSTVFSQ